MHTSNYKYTHVCIYVYICGIHMSRCFPRALVAATELSVPHEVHYIYIYIYVYIYIDVYTHIYVSVYIRGIHMSR